MAPYKLMISAVALVAFTASGAYADGQNHRDRGNQGQRAQAEQSRPREQAQPRREQASPRTYEPQRQVQSRTYEPQRQVQPRTYEPQRPQAQPRAYEPQRQVQPRTYEPQRQPQAYAQAQPRAFDPRAQGQQVRPDSRAYSGRQYTNVPERAVPRTYSSRPYDGGRNYAYVSPRIVRPEFGEFAPYRPYVYRPSIRIGVYYGYDGYYPYGYTPDYYFNPIPGHLYGGLRITGAPRDAQVFADGYYVGIVDDFDGIFQHLNLEAGPHHIEINEPGLQPVAFDVNIAPGRTVTFRADPYMFQP